MLLIGKKPKKHNHRDNGPCPSEKLPMLASMATAPPELELARHIKKVADKSVMRGY
jgi:hypothetical protein